MADKPKQVEEDTEAVTPVGTGNSLPEQVEDDVKDAPETPAPDEAGEGAENSANPVIDEARPDNLNTMGW